MEKAGGKRASLNTQRLARYIEQQILQALLYLERCPEHQAQKTSQYNTARCILPSRFISPIKTTKSTDNKIALHTSLPKDWDCSVWWWFLRWECLHCLCDTWAFGTFSRHDWLLIPLLFFVCQIPNFLFPLPPPPSTSFLSYGGGERYPFTRRCCRWYRSRGHIGRGSAASWDSTMSSPFLPCSLRESWMTYTWV